MKEIKIHYFILNQTYSSLILYIGDRYQYIETGMPTSGHQKAGDFFHFGGSFNKKAGGRR